MGNSLVKNHNIGSTQDLRIKDGPFFKYIEGDSTVLEKEPLEKVTELKEINAFRHEGFWQCMDHKLDKDYLDQLIIDQKAPWIK